MSYARCLLLIVPIGGCFFTEQINQRPSLDIRRDSSESIHRGGTVSLRAESDDPESQLVTYGWRVNACTDATDFATCDLEPFSAGMNETFVFVVPRYKADNVTPVRSLRVVLEGEDERGAVAKPSQVELLSVENGSPTLEVDKRSSYDFVVGTPVDLFAVYGDPDDDLANVELDWTAFSPTQVTATLGNLDVPQDPEHPELIHAGKELIPAEDGDWMIRITASDPVGPPTEKLLPVTIAPDRPPCLGQWSPIAPADPDQYLPIQVPTTFQVPVVTDDLDRFPAPVVDMYRGRATFQWTYQAPNSSSWVPFGTTSSVRIDPKAYPAGSHFQLRVEVFDRHATTVTCGATDQTCALDATRPTCLQRQTWRVEAR